MRTKTILFYTVLSYLCRSRTMTRTWVATPSAWILWIALLLCLDVSVVDAIHVPPIFTDLRAKFRNATRRRRQETARAWNAETDEVPQLPPAMPFSEIWFQIYSQKWFFPTFFSLVATILLLCIVCCCIRRRRKPDPAPVPMDLTKEC